MSVDSELIGRLQVTAGVTALVPSARIWGGRGPDNPTAADYPHIVCRMVSDVPEAVTTTDVIGSRRARYQVEPFAVTRAAAKSISEACIAALQGYRGTAIRDTQFELQVELYDDELSAWSAPTDFEVIHT